MDRAHGRVAIIGSFSALVVDAAMPRSYTSLSTHKARIDIVPEISFLVRPYADRENALRHELIFAPVTVLAALSLLAGVPGAC